MLNYFPPTVSRTKLFFFFFWCWGARVFNLLQFYEFSNLIVTLLKETPLVVGCARGVRDTTRKSDDIKCEIKPLYCLMTRKHIRQVQLIKRRRIFILNFLMHRHKTFFFRKLNLSSYSSLRRAAFYVMRQIPAAIRYHFS